MTDEDLMKKVSSAKKYLESLGYEVCYIGIYGSQNYGLAEYSDKYQSDIDFKAVIVPSLDDLVYNSQPKSTTLEFEGGQIDLKDIRIFMETIVKCNPAYIETLYTPYSIYTKAYEPIIREREQLVAEMGEFLLRACYGMIMEKVKAFSHPYPSIIEKVEKYGYDPKQLHHILRLYHMMDSYVKHGTFNLIAPNIEGLMKIKRGDVSLESAEVIRDIYQEFALELKSSYNIPAKFNAKERMLQYSKDLVRESIINKIRGKKLKSLNIEFCPICKRKTTYKKLEHLGEEWFNCMSCNSQFTHLFKEGDV